MASWTDWLLNNSAPLISAGTGLYDYLNKQGVQSDLQSYAQNPAIDPFGQGRRDYFGDQLLNLYTSGGAGLETLPGYQFRKTQGEQALNRAAARGGKYLSTNRLYDMMKFNQGLAEQAYTDERNALGRFAGADMRPDAGTQADLLSKASLMEAGEGATMAEGLGGLTDLLKKGSGAADASKAVSEGATPEATSDATGQAAAAMMDPMAQYGTGFGAVGVDQLANLGLENIAQSGTASQQLAATGPMGAGAYAPDQSGLQGLDTALADGPTTAGGDPGFFDQLSSGYDSAVQGVTDFLASGGADIAGQTMQGAQYAADPSMVNLGSDYASAGDFSAAGGALAAGGGYLGSQYFDDLIGQEQSPGTQAMGSVLGAGAGGAAAGAAGLAGTTAAGASVGAAGAAGAAMGPAIPLALAMMAYGGYAGGQAESKAQKQLAGQIFGGGALSGDRTMLNAGFGGPTGDLAGTAWDGTTRSIGAGRAWTAPNKQTYYIGDDEYNALYGGDIGRQLSLYSDTGTYGGYWDMFDNRFVSPEEQQQTEARAAESSMLMGEGGTTQALQEQAANLWSGLGEGGTTPLGGTVTGNQAAWADQYQQDVAAQDSLYTPDISSERQAPQPGRPVEVTTPSGGESTFWSPGITRDVR